MKADLDDKDSLRLALKDAYAVFSVTNWQEVLNKEKEIQALKKEKDQQNQQIDQLKKQNEEQARRIKELEALFASKK